MKPLVGESAVEVEAGQVYDGGYCTWTVLTQTIAGWWCLYEPKDSDHKGDVVLPANVLKKYGVYVGEAR